MPHRAPAGACVDGGWRRVEGGWRRVGRTGRAGPNATAAGDEILAAIVDSVVTTVL